MSAEISASDKSLLIVSSVKFLREALVEVFSKGDTLSVVGTAENQTETFAKLLLTNIGIVLMDASMPDAFDTAYQIRNNFPLVRTIVFAVVDEVENIIKWAEAGITGFLPCSSSINDVNKLVEDILLGKQQCSDRVASALMHKVARTDIYAERRRSQRSLVVLTNREREIMRLLSDGMSNKEIARTLNIEVATAKSHVHNLMAKLNLKRRGQAAQWFYKQSV